MAEGKNTVVVYKDWIDKFEALEDDEAGRLIKHFFRYVNDKDPEYPDKLTQISFIDIKNSLKRDLGKWDKKIEGRSAAGKASAEARRLLKENEQKSTNLTNVDFVKQKSTNPTDSVSDSVTVTVSDTVSVNVNESKNSSFKALLEKDEKWIKSIASQFKITDDEVFLKLQGFLDRLTSIKKNHPTLNDFTEHFNNWIPVNKQKNGNNKTTFAKNR